MPLRSRKLHFECDVTLLDVANKDYGGALKRLKAKMEGGIGSIIGLLIAAFKTKPNHQQLKLLERLELSKPKNIKEKIFQKLVTTQLK